jgi:glycine cleavage system H lipoate-binding protein
MADQKQQARRSQVGYGSSYRKAGSSAPKGGDEIDAVLGGQQWKVTPDQKAGVTQPCIWMQAGVVKFKNCNNYYDCTTCKYDFGMAKQVAKGKINSWQETMKRRPAMDRICRHSLTQRIDKRICAYDYECGHCDFDQFFEDVWNTQNKQRPQMLRQVKGFDLPVDQYYHNGHTWARIESGGNIRIGLDDFALKLFGKADALELPLMGKTLDQGVAGWGMRRKDNEAAVMSPVNGVILDVNPRVRENPDMANREPYGDGWLFVVRSPNIKQNKKALMDGVDSLEWINAEISQLENMIETVAGPLAADGGHLADDIYGVLPELGWQNLTRTFLKTG